MRPPGRDAAAVAPRCRPTQGRAPRAPISCAGDRRERTGTVVNRLVFLGTPAAAVPPLRALVDAGHDVRLVVTRADRRRSRRGEPEPSPVKAAAQDLGLAVAHKVDDVLDAGAELGVVVAFGRLIKPHVLDRVPMVNLHFSLLPRWRGAAPVERAILAGDAVTGVCVMAVDETLDTGAIYASQELAIDDGEHREELRERLVTVGTRLLVDTLARGLEDPRPQVGEPSYAEKISPEELKLDWGLPAEQLHRIVRVGRAWTTFRGRRLLVLRARVVAGTLEPGVVEGATVGAGEGALELVEVQPEGKQAQPAADWARGARLIPAERLGT